MHEIKYRKPEEMKDSGIEWLGMIPKQWDVVRVKNRFKLKKDKSFEKNPNVLSLTQRGIVERDITNNEGQLAASYEGYIKVEVGDFVLNPMDLISGYVDKSKFNGVISPAYTIFTSKSNNIYDDYYKYYFQMHYHHNYFFPYGEGVSFVHRWTLKNEKFLNYPILSCKKIEQQKIANFLDIKTAEFDSIISKKEKLIEKLEEAKKSLISEVVTGKVKIVDGQLVKRKPEEMKDSGVEWFGMIPKDWNCIRINNVADVIDPQPDHRAPKLAENDGYPYVGIRDINEDGTINYSTCRKVDLKAVIKQERSFKLDAKDIVFCRVGTLGYPRFIYNNERIALSATLCIIKPKKINSKFLKLSLESKALDYQMDLFSTGSTRKSLGMEVIRKFHILEVPNKEQDNIVQYLNLKNNIINKIIYSTKLQIERLKEAKQSLISEAVTGKIDLRDWEIIEQGE